MANMSRRLSYEAIKKAFLTATTTPIALEELKNHFQEDIASKRLRECIRTIGELFIVLERRDVISEFDVKALHIVANYCTDNAVKDYLKYYIPPAGQDQTYPNEYRELRLAERLRQSLNLQSRLGSCNPYLNPAYGREMQPQQQPQIPTTTTAYAFTAEKKAAVYKTLAKQLGSFWRRFGRYLDVTEGDMDNIELQFPRDLPSRVYKLMEIFEDDDSHDPKRHVLIICRALDECQRKDLRRKIEEIMSY